LEPVRVAYASQKRVGAVLVNDYAGHFLGESTHSARQPTGRFPAVKRYIGYACPEHLLSVAVIVGAGFVCFGSR
jgi:hypothetical protein